MFASIGQNLSNMSVIFVFPSGIVCTSLSRDFMCGKILSTRLHNICILRSVSMTFFLPWHQVPKELNFLPAKLLLILQHVRKYYEKGCFHPSCKRSPLTSTQTGPAVQSLPSPDMCWCSTQAFAALLSLAGPRCHLSMWLVLFVETPQKPLSPQASAVWCSEPAHSRSVKRLSVALVRQSGYELSYTQLICDLISW